MLALVIKLLKCTYSTNIEKIQIIEKYIYKQNQNF